MSVVVDPRNEVEGEPFYETECGVAFCADSLDVLRSMPEESVDLVITSPPYALVRKKAYGNVEPDEYADWFMPFATEINRVLCPTGSFVVDIGGSWHRGRPTRTLYHFELLIRLCSGEKPLFHLAQEFYWFNPAKMPAPAQWVTIERIRVKDAVNPIWWLSKTPMPKASNLKVLRPYTKSMRNLLVRGYNKGPRPSGHVVSDAWGNAHAGAIPPNILIRANTRSSDPYLKGCKEYGLPVHPARFVKDIPEFFIKFLTDEGDLVVDPFAGSNMVGLVAEEFKRHWISVEIDEKYVLGSAFRFPGLGEALVGRKAGPK